MPGFNKAAAPAPLKRQWMEFKRNELLELAQVIRRALQVNAPDPADPWDVLRKVGGFEIAGLVGGARTPVILTSRADTPAARRFSAAAAVLYADALARDPSILQPEIAE